MMRWCCGHGRVQFAQPPDLTRAYTGGHRRPNTATFEEWVEKYLVPKLSKAHVEGSVFLSRPGS
jgi:hypothetical protein